MAQGCLRMLAGSRGARRRAGAANPFEAKASRGAPGQCLHTGLDFPTGLQALSPACRLLDQHGALGAPRLC
eukprot:7600830-Alexandrium_andersonii.AAC.1